MSQIKRIQVLIDTLRECSQTLSELADDLKQWFDTPEQDALDINFSSSKEKQPPKIEIVPSLEEIRAVLADKTRAGLTDQVRGLIEKYGASRLSDVSPKHYTALLKDAKVLDVN